MALAMMRSKSTPSPHCYATHHVFNSNSRFEEIIDEPASSSASKKRPRQSDEAAAETPEKLTKAQKKANKKLKTESGAAVPSGSDAKVDAAKTNGEAAKEKKDKKEKEKKSESKAAEGGNTKTLEGGIQITDITIGKGPQAKKGNTVNMRYIGKLANGKVFDSNTKGKPVCGRDLFRDATSKLTMVRSMLL